MAATWSHTNTDDSGSDIDNIFLCWLSYDT